MECANQQALRRKGVESLAESRWKTKKSSGLDLLRGATTVARSESMKEVLTPTAMFLC